MAALSILWFFLSSLGYPLAPGPGYKIHRPPRQRFVAVAASSPAAAAGLRGGETNT